MQCDAEADSARIPESRVIPAKRADRRDAWFSRRWILPATRELSVRTVPRLFPRRRWKRVDLVSDQGPRYRSAKDVPLQASVPDAQARQATGQFWETLMTEPI